MNGAPNARHETVSVTTQQDEHHLEVHPSREQVGVTSPAFVASHVVSAHLPCCLDGSLGVDEDEGDDESDGDVAPEWPQELLLTSASMLAWRTSAMASHSQCRPAGLVADLIAHCRLEAWGRDPGQIS